MFKSNHHPIIPLTIGAIVGMASEIVPFLMYLKGTKNLLTLKEKQIFVFLG